MTRSTDIATLLDLACISATGSPLPAEFHTIDWTYRLKDGKKVGVFKITERIMRDPFTYYYPNNFSHQVSRTLINDELKDTLDNISMRQVQLPYFAPSYLAWGGNDEFVYRFKDELNSLQLYFKSKISTSNHLIHELRHRQGLHLQSAINHPNSCPYEKAKRDYKYEQQSFILLFDLISTIIYEHGSTALQDYFVKWLNLTDPKPAEDVMFEIKQQSDIGYYEPTPRIYKTGFKSYKGKHLSLNHYSRNFWKPAWDLTLQTGTTPKTKKDTWYPVWIGIIALNRDIPKSQSAGVQFQEVKLGRRVKKKFAKRKNFWRDIKEQSGRYEREDNFKQEFTNNLIRMAMN
tara:strand:+ start:458 stop:1495 length:1038 start_codon:yes stop_codon:yes gene_type:complete